MNHKLLIEIDNAIKRSNFELVKLLLSKIPEVRYYNNFFKSACMYGSLETIKLLLDKGAEINEEVIRWTIYNSRVEHVEVLNYLNNQLLIKKMEAL